MSSGAAFPAAWIWKESVCAAMSTITWTFEPSMQPKRALPLIIRVFISLPQRSLSAWK
eukprot:CAMPEP_0206175192 /NCGR_PEP_ID=MMETSP1474-20131121/54258_1 /ASSEMBLY_ACC=CAM_ASM_001110 /TAXON_ID=97495 /ORGANISM="Imantonia sp., Strain RCC918" /LENGTH=57 /DNA_ID=CAMNT_0053585279 /DNA_START=326 /DNA_END=499 /DNA_ORIENTATION=-